MADATDLLVVEAGPDAGVGRLGEWLAAAGLRLVVTRLPAGQPRPPDLTGYAGLVVLGSDPPGHPDPGASWRPECESLLRTAVRQRVPVLALGLGGQLLAAAHGGRVAPAAAGPGIGPALVARRDAAEVDPLFARVPFTPDVLQWHRDEVVELPPGAVLLAAATRYPHQAFRIGPAAWGLQFHIEPDAAAVAGWISRDAALLAELGRDPAALQAAVEAVLDDLAEVWQPFADRFAALVRGELAAARPELPLCSPGDR